MNNFKRTAILIVVVTLLTGMFASCGDDKNKYVIGVAQCSEDSWREKLNAELQAMTYFYDNVELRFANANDDVQLQKQQLMQFADDGVDMIIVAPITSREITPVVEQVMERGIPVITFDRKIDSDRFTAYIGCDNYQMGYTMGRYVAGEMNGSGRVVEITGMQGSSPMIERHRGFVDAIKQYPDISIIATVPGNWKEQSGYHAMDSLLRNGVTEFDYVFGHNDRLALGAIKAMRQNHVNRHVDVCGIDALNVPGGGIEQVQKGVFTASYIYPTKGDELMELAMNILQGKPYRKYTKLQSALVTPENVNVIQMQYDEIASRQQQLKRLNGMIDRYLSQLSLQRVALVLAACLLVLAVVVIVSQWRIARLRQSRSTMSDLYSSDISRAAQVEPQEPTAAEASEKQITEAVPPADECDSFAARLRDVLQTHLCDPQLDVDMIAQHLGMSRAGLYRKVKALTGQSAVELIRESRLKRAHSMLTRGNQTVSEIAYAVGFSSPAYFTKCYKDYFGHTPKNIKNQS
ncbi:MAG: substrate-binding domain-containing protein [Muribaculaceae bacterium]